jgi:GTPase
MRDHLDKLMHKLHERKGQAIDMSFWSNLFSFDVMGEVGFSRSFNMLDDEKEHKAIKGLHESMKFVGTMGHVPWLMQFLGSIPGMTGAYGDFVEWCVAEVKKKQSVSWR